MLAAKRRRGRRGARRESIPAKRRGGIFFARCGGRPIAALVLPRACRRDGRVDRPFAVDIEENMLQSLPEQMFVDLEKSRLTMLRSWVLDHQVNEIDMNERQFWTFAALQPVAEKPW